MQKEEIIRDEEQFNFLKEKLKAYHLEPITHSIITVQEEPWCFLCRVENLGNKQKIIVRYTPEEVFTEDGKALARCQTAKDVPDLWYDKIEETDVCLHCKKPLQKDRRTNDQFCSFDCLDEYSRKRAHEREEEEKEALRKMFPRPKDPNFKCPRCSSFDCGVSEDNLIHCFKCGCLVGKYIPPPEELLQLEEKKRARLRENARNARERQALLRAQGLQAD